MGWVEFWGPQPPFRILGSIGSRQAERLQNDGNGKGSWLWRSLGLVELGEDFFEDWSEFSAVFREPAVLSQTVIQSKHPHFKKGMVAHCICQPLGLLLKGTGVYLGLEGGTTHEKSSPLLHSSAASKRAMRRDS